MTTETAATKVRWATQYPSDQYEYWDAQDEKWLLISQTEIRDWMGHNVVIHYVENEFAENQSAK